MGTKYARRPGTRQRHITISDEGYRTIKGWADERGTSFSGAIETLARLGMGESPATALIPLMASVVRRAVTSQMKHIAQLAASAAIYSGIAANMSGATLRMAIQDRAKTRRDFADTIFLTDPEDSAEEVYREIRRRARANVAHRLSDPIESLIAALGATPQIEPQAEQKPEKE